jgi:hypothetical protein
VPSLMTARSFGFTEAMRICFLFLVLPMRCYEKTSICWLRIIVLLRIICRFALSMHVGRRQPLDLIGADILINSRTSVEATSILWNDMEMRWARGR